MPLTVTLPTGKTMVATSAIQLDMLIDDYLHVILLYITHCKPLSIK